MRIVYNDGPELIHSFMDTYSSDWIDDFNIIVDALEYLTEYYTRARYPFLLKGRVYSPSEIIDRETAEEGVVKANRVLEVVRNYLRRKDIL